MTQEKLTAMNIIATRGLDISPNLKELTAASKSAGESLFTSSSWMYKHLQMLQDLVPRSVRLIVYVSVFQLTLTSCLNIVGG